MSLHVISSRPNTAFYNDSYFVELAHKKVTLSAPRPFEKMGILLEKIDNRDRDFLNHALETDRVNSSQFTEFPTGLFCSPPGDR